jgi:ABC-type glutathione transport system ATPase component
LSIFDEPTSALDLKNQALALGWIAGLSRSDGLTIVLTTHHPHHALAIADDALLMLGERDYAAGPAAAVPADPEPGTSARRCPSAGIWNRVPRQFGAPRNLPDRVVVPISPASDDAQ